MSNKILAIIPARGGSKRLPKKNIMQIEGKPLIAWTIEAAKKSKFISKSIVSSDDDDIIDIAVKYNINTIKRPDSLATDTSTTIDTIKHVINNLEETFDYIILLQPTSPLRNSNYIDEAIKTLNKMNADAIISICETEHNPLWSNTLPKNKSMNSFLKDDLKNLRSQDLEKFYRINGAIYICKVSKLLEENSLFLKNNIYGFEMPIEDSIDIDNKFDFLVAQTVLKNKEK